MVIKHDRLQASLKSSNDKLRPFRNMYAALVRQYSGPTYATDESTRERYLNLLAQTVEAYMMILAANNPRVSITSKEPELAGFASHFSVALNGLVQEIGLDATLQAWVMDSFFCMGVIKVHMADSNRVEVEGDLYMDPGSPFASNVAFDDFVIDMSAKKISEAQFMGDIYTVPYDDLKDERYDQKAVEVMTGSSSIAVEQDSKDLSQSGYNREFLEPMVDLIDIWIPRDKKIYTYHVSNRSTLTIGDKVLAENDWVGSEHGNYHLLRMGIVPNNIMPASPASHLYALDRTINNLMTKQADQAERQKTNPVYSAAGATDAESLKNAGDGEWVRVDDPREVSVIKQGGATQETQVHMLQSMEQYDRMAGNLSAMLGLGASSDTVGQDKMINAAGSRKENSLAMTTMLATTRLLRDLGFMLWHDKFKVIPGRVTIDGLPEYSADATWHPGDREGELTQYDFAVDIHSMKYQTPGQKGQAVLSLVTSTYAPMVPFMQSQGGSIDFAALTDILAESMDIPRLREVIKFRPPDPSQPVQPQPAGSPGQANKPNGEYTRTNVSGGGQRAVPDAGAWGKVSNG